MMILSVSTQRINNKLCRVRHVTKSGSINVITFSVGGAGDGTVNHIHAYTDDSSTEPIDLTCSYGQGICQPCCS